MVAVGPCWPNLAAQVLGPPCAQSPQDYANDGHRLEEEITWCILKAYAQEYYVQSLDLQNCIQTNYKSMSLSALSNEFDNIDCKTVPRTGNIIEDSKLLALLSEKKTCFCLGLLAPKQTQHIQCFLLHHSTTRNEEQCNVHFVLHLHKYHKHKFHILL